MRVCVVILAAIAVATAVHGEILITIDGEVNDWVHIPAISAEKTGDGSPFDIRQVKITQDPYSLLLAVTWGTALPKSDVVFNVLLDLDTSPSTGFHVGPTFGADRLLQGGVLYEFLEDGTNSWNWKRITACGVQIVQNGQARVMEISIPKQCLDWSSSLAVRVLSDGSGTDDWVPNSCAYTVELDPVPGLPKFPIASLQGAQIVYYGQDFSPAALDALSRYRLVILHPSGSAGLTPAKVAYIQSHGVVPKLVLGYISIGEENAGHPPVTTTASPSGPVYFDMNTGQIEYRNQGVATYYVDAVQHAPWYGDGVPDANPFFGGRFINPDASWRLRLQTQRLPGDAAGFDQILGARTSDDDTDRSNNFGFDGVFLDTLDTAGPWNAEGYYPWTAPAFRDTLAWMYETFPGAAILANRGVFFFNPFITSPVYGIRPYDYNIAPYISFSLFESFYLDSDASHTSASPYHCENACVYANKIDSLSRVYGFTPTSLDYALNRPDSEIQASINSTLIKHGWLHYLSPDAGLADGFGTEVLDYIGTAEADTAAPVWVDTSLQYCSEGCTTSARVGTGAIEFSGNPVRPETVIYVDIARDMSLPVNYVVYAAEGPDYDDFQLVARHPPVYPANDNWIQGGYPLQLRVPGCSGSKAFRVHAVDAVGNEDSNDHSVMFDCSYTPAMTNPAASVVVDGTPGEWTGLSHFGDAQVSFWVTGAAAHDSSTLFVYYEYTSASPPRIFIDTDANKFTGYKIGSIGAEVLVESNKWMFSYTGPDQSTTWSWAWLRAAQKATTTSGGSTMVELSFPLTSSVAAFTFVSSDFSEVSVPLYYDASAL